MLRRTVIQMQVGWFLVLLALACSRAGAPTAVERIDSAGGFVKLGNDVQLTVPAGSLAAEAEIGIEALGSIPKGDTGGFTAFGQAYRFSPPGTAFSLSQPAQLTMRLDTAAMAARGLDSRTVQLFYLDETQHRFMAVPTRLDADGATANATIEHFTVYLAMAQGLVPGNAPPVVTLQGSVPATPRAFTPLLVRATVRDYTSGGAIAGATVTYGNGTSSSTLVMSPDPSPNAGDTWYALIPSSVPPSAITSYTVTATDNLGAQMSVLTR